MGAQVQLVVLSLIDPTGLLSFLITYAFGVWLDASYVKSHSRFAESQADDTGVQVMQTSALTPMPRPSSLVTPCVPSLPVLPPITALLRSAFS